jgi:hypothetical protein
MPITYEPLATTTLGTAAATVTFSSISGAYTDLVLVCNIQGINTISEAAALYLEYNSDSGSNYSSTRLMGNGSTASSSRYSNQTENFIGLFPAFTTAGSKFGPQIIYLQNYSNSTTYKTILSRFNSEGTGVSGEDRVGAFVGLWRSTAAITTIDLTSSASGGFATGSTFTLYGIKAF